MFSLRKMRADYDQYYRMCGEKGISPWDSRITFGKNKKLNYYDHWKALLKEGIFIEEPTGRG